MRFPTGRRITLHNQRNIRTDYDRESAGSNRRRRQCIRQPTEHHSDRPGHKHRTAASADVDWLLLWNDYRHSHYVRTGERCDLLPRGTGGVAANACERLLAADQSVRGCLYLVSGEDEQVAEPRPNREGIVCRGPVGGRQLDNCGWSKRYRTSQ